MNNRDVVEIQIGRPPRSDVVVAHECHFNLPVVTVVPPHLDDGTPFPTTYWLTCPLMMRRISRIESEGGVRAYDERISTDIDFAAEFAAAASRYASDRDAMVANIDAVAPTGGIGGSRGGVKCLHSHLADTLAGNENPIGRELAGQVMPLDCASPCVVAQEGTPVWNQAWKEPHREGRSG
ncbi:MAG: DUF501 domain-containing protein [Acidobacteria bacterium]|nr:DUF501 domain-containing protein [Acidobacteriota bacterium]